VEGTSNGLRKLPVTVSTCMRHNNTRAVFISTNYSSTLWVRATQDPSFPSYAYGGTQQGSCTAGQSPLLYASGPQRQCLLPFHALQIFKLESCTPCKPAVKDITKINNYRYHMPNPLGPAEHAAAAEGRTGSQLPINRRCCLPRPSTGVPSCPCCPVMPSCSDLIS
jgi:hypothetical protein